MDISSTASLKPYDGPLKKEKDFDPDLMRVSKQFESIFVTKMMKDGFKASNQFKDIDNEDSGSKAYSDMAYDQLARFMGSNSNTGLAEAIYQSLKR